MTKALFISLDKTIIRPISGNRFNDKDDWTLIEGVKDVINNFMIGGYKIVIVSNQGSISLGYITEQDFIDKIIAVCDALEEDVEGYKNSISYYYTTNMGGYNRKPNPGMAYEAAVEYELDLSNSIMVGNMATDREFAVKSGIGTFIWADDFIS